MSTNSTTSGPAISFSGLGSGIDTASIVSQLMKLERAPIDRIEADKKTLNTKKGVVQEINSLLGKLRDAAAEMYKPNALAAKTATAADPRSSARARPTPPRPAPTTSWSPASRRRTRWRRAPRRRSPPGRA